MGASMGAIQAWEWAASYPDMVPRLVSVIGTPGANAYAMDVIRDWADPIRVNRYGALLLGESGEGGDGAGLRPARIPLRIFQGDRRIQRAGRREADEDGHVHAWQRLRQLRRLHLEAKAGQAA